MDGMQMMMKALGVDPNAIMQAAGTFQEGLKKVMDDLATIKAQQAEILSRLEPRVTLIGPDVLVQNDTDKYQAVSNG